MAPSCSYNKEREDSDPQPESGSLSMGGKSLDKGGGAKT